MGGGETWALLALFQDISFIDAPLRPEYSECGPCIRAGLHLLRTEVEGNYSETFPASWHCCVAKCMRQAPCHNKEGLNEFKCQRTHQCGNNIGNFKNSNYFTRQK